MEIFSDYIPFGKIQPKLLFAIIISVSGYTSAWSTVWKHFSILNAILDVTNGKIPKQQSLTKCLDKWLRDRHAVWSYKCVDAASGRLRCMLQSLLKYGRDHNGQAPAK